MEAEAFASAASAAAQRREEGAARLSQVGLSAGIGVLKGCPMQRHVYTCLFKSLRLRPPTPEAYGKTADFGTLCIPGSSQRRDRPEALQPAVDKHSGAVC